jgi:hypothetical protein
VKTELAISASTGAVATDPLLLPLVDLIEEDIFLISGIRINGTTAHVGTPAVGDISFSLLSKNGIGGHPGGVAYTDPDAEKYFITIDGRGAAVTCYAYTGCAWGVTSLLQTLCVSGVPVQTAAFPTFNLTDSPDIPYRGMLVDTARSLVTPHDLMEAAQTARYYKIRYLHLHLTDDHSWTFPSTKFPHLGDQNIGFRGRSPKVYSTQQLQQLVSYADVRGVTVIPELEGPGHSSAMRRSDPSFNGQGGETGQGGGVINAANQSVYDGMASIVQEMADIFKSSPYIHVGCDETSTPPSLPGYQQFANDHNISGGEDLFAYYVKTMVEAVKKTGKKPMIWYVQARAHARTHAWIHVCPRFVLHICCACGRGPAAMQRLEPDDAVVMVWQGSDGVAEQAEARGLQWINCPNGGGNITQEFGRATVDFGDTPVCLDVLSRRTHTHTGTMNANPGCTAGSQRGARA